MNPEIIKRRCDKVIRFAFYALIYFTPISIALVESFAGLVIFTFFLKRFLLFLSENKGSWKKGRSAFSIAGKFISAFRPPKTYLSLPIAIFVLANLLSVVFSQYFFQSFQAFFGKMLQGVFVYYAFIEAFKTEKQIRRFIAIFFVSALLTTTNGIFQYFTNHGFVRGHDLNTMDRVRSSLRHANDLGTYLVVVISLLISCVFSRLFLFKNKRYSSQDVGTKASFWAQVLLLLLAILCLGLTLSRGAWLSFFMVLAILGLRNSRILIPSIIVCTLFLFIFNPALKMGRNVSMFSDKVTAQKQEAPSSFSWLRPSQYKGAVVKLIDKAGGQGRGLFWREAVAIIRDYPVIGSGLNTYTKMCPRYNENKDAVYPHNCYLQMTAETGAVGLLSFLWIIFAFSRNLFRKFRFDSQYINAIDYGATCGFFGLLFHSFFDTAFYSVQLSSLIWILMGISVAVQRASSVPSQEEEGPPAFLKKIVPAFIFKKSFILGVRKVTYSFLLFILSCIIFFSIGEICFRVFAGPPNPLIDITQKKVQYLFEPNTVQSSKSVIPGEFEYTSRINNHGYRGKDFSKEKPIGGIRILALGDSFTFGVGSQDDETIPSVMEQELTKAGFNIEVINAGIGHTSPITHYLNLKNIHLKYDLDLVVLLFDLTDLWDDWRKEKNAIFNEKGFIEKFDNTYINGRRVPWIVCMKHSAFCKWINAKVVRSFKKIQLLGFWRYMKIAIQGKRAKAAIINSEKEKMKRSHMDYDGLLMLRGRKQKELIDKHWKRTAKYLTRIKELLDAKQIKMLLVMYPHGIYVGKDQWDMGREPWGFERNKLYTDYYPFELVEKFAKEQGIDFINTLEAFPKNSKTKFFYDYDGHLTPAGCEIVAKAIVCNKEFKKDMKEILIERKLAPFLFVEQCPK